MFIIAHHEIIRVTDEHGNEWTEPRTTYVRANPAHKPIPHHSVTRVEDASTFSREQADALLDGRPHLTAIPFYGV